MPGPTLSYGSLERILQGEELERPIFQILGVKPVFSNGIGRLRLLISDGKYMNSHFLAALHLNHLYDAGKLTENTVVRIDKYITSFINYAENDQRLIVVILELTILISGIDQRIGEPTNYSKI